jgi:uncharacterized membrane protein YedE/YeeE
MESQSIYLWPLMGGLLIGVSTSLFLLSVGRVTGISGIIGNLFNSSAKDRLWRVVYIVGLMLGAFVFSHQWPQFKVPPQQGSLVMMLIAGLLVGYGTRLANGCTSGHGICGIARLSKRSLIATCTFMAFGMITVFLMKKAGF